MKLQEQKYIDRLFKRQLKSFGGYFQSVPEYTLRVGTRFTELCMKFEELHKKLDRVIEMENTHQIILGELLRKLEPSEADKLLKILIKLGDSNGK